MESVGNGKSYIHKHAQGQETHKYTPQYTNIDKRYKNDRHIFIIEVMETRDGLMYQVVSKFQDVSLSFLHTHCISTLHVYRLSICHILQLISCVRSIVVLIYKKRKTKLNSLLLYHCFTSFIKSTVSCKMYILSYFKL